MKKPLALILACLLALGLFAGCGAGNPPAQSSSGGSSASADKPAEKVVIKLALQTGMKEYNTLADNYTAKNKNVTFQIEEYPSTEFAALLKAKLAGGECWDVFSNAISRQGTLADGGHLADLSDMQDIIKRYKDPDTVIKTRTRNGMIVGLPAQYQYVPLFYNKALLTKLNLKLPNNWQEFLEVIKSAKSADLVPISAGFKETWTCFHWVAQVASQTVQKDDMNWGDKRHNKETTFAATPGWAEAFDKVKELIAAGAFSSSAVSTSDEQAMMSFLNGKTLFYFTGTWSLNSILKAMPDGFELGAVRVPSNDQGEEACTSTSLTGDFSVWSHSPVLEEAKKFLAFTLSPEQNLILNTTKGPSPFADVNVPLNPALVEYEDTLKTSGGKVAEWPNFQQRWPDGSPYPDPICSLVQELFYPEMARKTPDILKALDVAWDDASK